MANLELSVIDALSIEALLCILDSHINLGDEFKAMYLRYQAALHEAGIFPVSGNLVPSDFDMLGFGN